MRKIVLLTVLAVLAGCNAAAAAGWTTMYYDSRRTGGHKRSVAAFQADLKACARQAHLPFNNRTHDLATSGPDTPAFISCMAGRGLTWQYSHPRPAPRQTAVQRSRSQGWGGWTIRHNDPRNVSTDYATPPAVSIDIPPIVEPPSPPLSIYDPQVNPGVFMHRDDQPAN